MVGYCNDVPCRIWCAHSICFISETSRMEIHTFCIYDTKYYFSSSVGIDLPVYFNDQMGVLNSVIRVFDKDFSVQWFYQSPYAFWAVTLTWLFYAVIVTLIVLNDLMAIPKELIEAAKLDGANGWQLIRFVELPLCRISIGTGMLCSITSRISMYEAIALTTAGGPGDDTMSLSVLLVRAITDYNYGFANAIGVIMFLIGLLVMYIVTKAFRMNDSIY